MVMEKSLKNMAAKIAQYVDEAAIMTVETKCVAEDETGNANLDQAEVAIRSVISLDGTSETTVPLQTGNNGQLAVDSNLYDVHERNVQAAIKYRARMMSSLLTLVRPFSPHSKIEG